MRLFLVIFYILINNLSVLANSLPTTGWLHTNNNKIYNENNEIIILKGVSLADPRQLDTKPHERPGMNAKKIAALATDNFFAKVVRIPILPEDSKNGIDGFFNNMDSYFSNHIYPLVTELTLKGIYVIIDLHYVKNYSDLYPKVEKFWKYIAPKFKDNPYVLFEIFNEPILPDNWHLWKKTIAEPTYKLIRELAPKNLILIGGPFWSSHLSEASANPIEGINIVYVGHVYSSQSSKEWKKNFSKLAKKFPLFITEWGFELKGTEGGDHNYGKEFERWMNENGISWTVWSFDNIWGPRMFNNDWSLRANSGEMGPFIKELLLENHQKLLAQSKSTLGN